MSVQITIRISEDSANFIDSLVAEGSAKSRAAAVDKMVLRQRRRAQAEQDLLRLIAVPPTAEDHQWLTQASAHADEVWADLD
jgi:Arc/MetJ-type ribon-helix-helix transcriptional regulator